MGFSDSVHDRSVCLFHGTRPVVAIEEERLTRQRYGIDFGGLDRRDEGVFRKLKLDAGSGDDHGRRLKPLIDYCLNAAGIRESDVTLWIGNSLHTAFPLYDRAVYINHHLAHAASTYFGSGAARAAVLVIDGYGDSVSSESYETVSIYRAEGAEMELVHRVAGVPDGLHLSNSLGIFYRIATLLSGFGVVDEGKAMGLAGHGQPRYSADIMKHVRFETDRVLIDNEAIWAGCQHLRFDATGDQADVAASFQSVLEEIVLYYARLAKTLTGEDHLCLAGGVALNCVSNQRVLESAGLATVWAFPAAADNGISFGAAYFGAHVLYRGGPAAGLKTPFLGRGYTRDEILAALETIADGVVVEEVGPMECSRRAAVAIADGRLVMWFQEGSEIGPRALGHRSLFGDPRLPHARDYINASVKSRESFRPLAPMVLEEEAPEWFSCERSPYMMFTPSVRSQTRRVTPAVVHADGTARVQTLTADDNAVVHAMLCEFKRLTGVPMVINTSFNIHGEPIVETPLDAVRAFADSPVPVLCIDGFHVVKREHEQ
ncbi:carbamoyltransferase family protein [Actinoplanes sichuanensis]|uniref:carbamoyltransferase family protein n=1 Tax=Actinoplanes sichuanensis TaxID=512349 RepID=UPI0029531100|nr:carbamoyltransferase C-terminal domain-containing protein [Actinoplanes sichuanensis]